jgi:hypothetical protein
MAGGTLKCWGYNGYGQLGTGSWNTQYSPQNVGLSGNAVFVRFVFFFRALN